MKPTLSAVAAVAVFKFGFRASWKISLLAGAATLVVLGLPSLAWQRKNEALEGLPATVPKPDTNPSTAKALASPTGINFEAVS